MGFEANLSQSQKEEMENQKAYEDLKAAKEAEIAAGQEQIDKKTAELADTDEKNAQAKEDLEDTKISFCRRGILDDVEGKVCDDRQRVGRATEDTTAGNGG